MYGVILAVHNILRWAALALGVIAAVRAYRGWFGKREWADADRKLGIFFSSAIDMQLLFGLLLYFVYSPIVKGALANFEAAMSNPGMRFFAIEHALMMALAVIFAHLGSLLPKKAQDALTKHKRAAIWISLALLAILAGMPWSRPLFPGL
jgi:hypothetical protein